MVLFIVKFVNVEISQSDCCKSFRAIETTNIFTSDMYGFDVLKRFEFVGKFFFTQGAEGFSRVRIQFYKLFDFLIVQVFEAQGSCK